MAIVRNQVSSKNGQQQLTKERQRATHSVTMQPTVSPWAWVSSLDRRARTRAAAEHARPHAREHDKFAFYGLRKDTRHFIRLDPLPKGLLLPRQWAAPTAPPITWRVDRFHDVDTWEISNMKGIPNFRPYDPVSIVLPPRTP